MNTPLLMILTSKQEISILSSIVLRIFIGIEKEREWWETSHGDFHTHIIEDKNKETIIKK